jgi:hypothetical protein
LARSYLERSRARADLALGLIDQALASAGPHRHSVWAYAAAARVQTLLDLDRAEEGREFGRWALAQCASVGMQGSANLVRRSLSECEAFLGDHAAALLGIAPIMARIECGQLQGLSAGMTCETRARIAIYAGDADSFDHYLSQCREHFQYGKHGPLTARVDRLGWMASQAGLVKPWSEQEHTTLHSELIRETVARCVSSAEVPERLIELLVRCAHAESGHLYGVGTRSRADALVHLASTSPAEAAVQAFVEAQLPRLRSLEQQTDELGEGPAALTELEVPLTLGSLCYHATALYEERGGDPRLVAVAVLGTKQGEWLWPLEALPAVGRALGELLDAAPLDSDEPRTTSERRRRSKRPPDEPPG